MKKTCIYVILILFLIVIFKQVNKQFKTESTPDVVVKNILELNNSELYHTCVYSNNNVEEITNSLNDKVIEVNDYLKKYKVYVSYEEFDNKYYYGYRDNSILYGASLIKLVDSLYVLDNDIDINKTVKYTNSYYNTHNKGLKNNKVGDNITYKDLITYALSVSDNGAHEMLIDNIGLYNIKKYANSLGATSTLTGGDKYGNQTAKDTSIYLKRLYELRDKPNYQFIIDAMINDFHSYLSVDNLTVAHKYGFYSDKFHDIGIVFDEHPYSISVLTLHAKNNYKEIINNVSKKVNELHNEYWNLKNEYCEKLITGE